MMKGDASIRDHLVIDDGCGILHMAVLCDQSSDSPFVVALCAYVDAIDYAVNVLKDPRHFKPPERHWTVEDERPGLCTCLFCLGA